MDTASRRRTRCLPLGLMLCAAANGQPAQEPSQSSQPETTEQSNQPTMALWQARELDFIYRSPVATHTCQNLRYRVATVLVAMGAKPDIRVSADNCDAVLDPEENSIEPWRAPSEADPWRRSSMPPFESDRLRERGFSREGQQSRVRIHLTSPVEVTPAAIQEWKKDKSKRELIARVTGNPAPILETTGQFPAEWQTVKLTRSTADLEPEDCALLEQLSTSVLRKLSVRNVRVGGQCDPRHPSRIPPQLTAEALMSNPYGGPAPAKEEPKQDEQPAPVAPSDAPGAQPPTTSAE